MEWTTHALSGIALGYLVTNDWKGAVVGGVASLIPDLDEPKSKFGKPLFFLSIPLNQLVGHRTLTHSLLFALIAGILVYVLWGWLYGVSVLSGILAHIVGDMITGRVQFLYPLKPFIGIPTTRAGYLVIDRTFRFGLIGFLFFIGYQELQYLM